MAIYKFRVTFEDNEDVYRDIEIKSSQNFEDLHKMIQNAIGFDSLKSASFFLSDDSWRKGDEITLKPVPVKQDDDDDDDYGSRKKPPQRIMKDCKLAGYIDDPHQKFVYVSDPEVQWTLLVELMRIAEADPKSEYPKIVKSAGLAPRQYKTAVLPPPEEDEDEEPNSEKFFQAEESYDTSGEEDDGLDAEEGEEEESGNEEGEFGEQEFEEDR